MEKAFPSFVERYTDQFYNKGVPSCFSFSINVLLLSPLSFFTPLFPFLSFQDGTQYLFLHNNHLTIIGLTDSNEIIIKGREVLAKASTDGAELGVKEGAVKIEFNPQFENITTVGKGKKVS
jgi:hypothetical protein